MLIFSVPFQFYWMIFEGNPLGSLVSKKGAYPATSRHHQCHGWPFTIDIPLLAFFRPQQLGASVPVFFIPQHCLLAAACHTCTCPRRQSMLGSGIPLARLSWAEARVKIARMTLTIKLDGNWSSFQLANSAPPLSITVALLPLPQGCSFSSCSPRSYPTHPLTFPSALAFNYLSLPHFTTPISFRQQLEHKAPQKL